MSNDKKQKTDSEFSRMKSSLIEKLEETDETRIHFSVLRVLEKIIDAKKVPFAVCYYCDNLAFCQDDFTELRTRDYGYEKMFCRDCVNHCYGCGRDYCDIMAYEHEECKNVDSDASSEENKE